MALLVPCLMSQGDASPTGSCRLVQRASPSRISGGRRQARTQETRFLALRGGGSALGSDGDAITEEQAGEELIKAAVEANIDGLDPAGLNLLVQAGAPVNYQAGAPVHYQAGAPVNYQDMWKRTPLHYAAREGQLAAITRLVELGGDLTAQDFLARTPLHLAARKVDFLSRTPLHLAARKGHADAVVLLTELGSDINHPDKNPWPNNSGRTALHWACYKGHPEVVWRLCEQGADLEGADLEVAHVP
ncbi:ankyrin repeat-containing domain protein [Baffinella frigidus]|nr:ankyrin repeat-containing domain protein [Cryptophyta sp. CCMP2293]